MKCKILHESKNRIRIHTYFSHMKCEEADIIEYYIKSLPYVGLACGPGAPVPCGYARGPGAPVPCGYAPGISSIFSAS